MTINIIRFISNELMKYGLYTHEQAIKRAKELSRIPRCYWNTFDIVETVVMNKTLKIFNKE